MSNTWAEGATPPPDTYDFSVVLGGPLYQLVRRARLSGDALEMLVRRLIAIPLFAWLPLLILSVLGGRAWRDAVKVPFLADIEAHARFLLALPLLIGAELVVHQRMRPVARQFLERGLIPERSRARFDLAVAPAARLRNSMMAGLLIAFVPRPCSELDESDHASGSRRPGAHPRRRLLSRGNPIAARERASRWREAPRLVRAIRDRYDFWAFSYDSGNPIVFSAMILRDALTSAVKLLDPEGKDPGLKQMVVIGHSQGGLLTKMTAVNTGSQLYDAAFKKPLDQLNISEETREIVRKTMFVEPLPFVKQVIFISTPHRGSYQAASDLVRSLVQRLVSTPARLVKGTTELLANREAFAVSQGGNRLPTAVDNMSPRHPFIKTLSIIPVDPGVDAYSIIAVKGDGPIETGNDGVVMYESAHIDGVKSELVVRWEHSVQGQPEAILEVRRILLLNAGAK